MSEMRQNMLTGEWIVYAQGREKRPYDFVRALSLKNENTDNCPFCGGNESKTPWPIIQDGENGHWKLRVFENRYPVVSLEETQTNNDMFYRSLPGIGRHEVLVDTPHHKQTIDQFTQEHLVNVLGVLKERAKDISREDFTKYLQIFKNCGPDAGMSLAHSHWQIVGFPTIPKRVLAWRERSLSYKTEKGRCMLCDILRHEKQQKSRLVFENNLFAAFTPYAGRFPYEALILPKEHISSFVSLDKKHMEDLGDILLRLIKRLCQLRKDIGFNICFMEEPKTTESGVLHWHIQIYPRVGGFAGVEFATETYINSVLPEKAAAFYRGESL